MKTGSPILVVANSARYLVQSALLSGHVVDAVDAFADLDTRLACRHWRKAVSCSPEGLDAALADLDIDQSMPWVYGAGFETQPEILRTLACRRRQLLGNDPGVMLLLADPSRLFPLLEYLDIRCPEVSLQPPSCSDGWLFKAAGRLGGNGVTWARDAGSPAVPGYYQAFVRGPLCSVLFAADGKQIRPIGFNRLLVRYPAAGDFRYAGAVSGFQPSSDQEQVMLQVASRLTRALSLRGINGLDFVIRDGEPLLLDVNARPPATLELYEMNLARGGFATHLDACRGRLPGVVPRRGVRGMRVMYARRDHDVGHIAWPLWASDRPVNGSRLNRDEPICTLHAAGAGFESVEAQLRQQADVIDSLVNELAREAA